MLWLRVKLTKKQFITNNNCCLFDFKSEWSGWFISQKIVQPWFKQTISQLVELEQEKLLSSLYLNLLNFHIAVPTNYIETVSQFFRSPIYPYS